MFDRILVPLDGSRVGEAALPAVKALVSKLVLGHKIEVILFQVVSTLVHYVIAGEASAQIPYSPHEMDLIKKDAQAYLDKIAAELAALGASVQVKIATGNPAEAIIRMAEETKVDLIAMSTHGRSGLSRWAFGSVAEKVLQGQGASIPVLLVRGTPPQPSKA